MRVLLLTTATFGAIGGIPKINQLVCRGLSGHSRPVHTDVLSLSDASEDWDTRYLRPERATFRGFSGDRVALVKTALQYALSRQYDVIIAAHVNLAPLAYLLRILQPRSHYVVYVYGIDVWFRLSLARRATLAKADRIFSISQFTAQRMSTSNRISSGRIRILPNCLDPYWIEEAQMAGTRLVNIELPAGEMLLSVGRMTLGERYKGHEQIISALPRVIEAVPDAFYVAVGEGDLVDSLRELAQKVGVDGRVIFPGRVSSDELKSYYDRASLFVLPSKGEGFGFVYLEAMYHRNAVIAGNRDAAAEVVRHGETGLLVDPDDINGLANTIVGLLKDDRRREAMGQRGHELVLQEYTFERFQHRLLSYLEELISDKR